MLTTPEQLQQWLGEPEGLHLEFKEAKTRYDFEKLVRYCVALANEGGGKIILGVTDRRPRQIVGTLAFDEPGRTEAGLHQQLSHRIPVEELRLPDGRVSVGAVEAIGRGRGARYILSAALYAALGAKGTHTRKKGLDHETNKALLLKHVSEQEGQGAPLADLRQVLPALPSSAVQALMHELRDHGQVCLVGQRRWARWKLPEYAGTKESEP